VESLTILKVCNASKTVEKGARLEYAMTMAILTLFGERRSGGGVGECKTVLFYGCQGYQPQQKESSLVWFAWWSVPLCPCLQTRLSGQPTIGASNTRSSAWARLPPPCIGLNNWINH